MAESNPDQRVLRCYSCTQREKKLWSKKSGKTGAGPLSSDELEEETDQQRTIVFHNPSYVEFINNEALLRARITCYCRHHDEKVGFRFVAVLFVLFDFGSFFFFFLFFS